MLPNLATYSQGGLYFFVLYASINIMKIVETSILKQLRVANPASHKGQNGRILVLAGSKKYHGSLLLSMQAAARIVDMVYVHSVEQNLNLIQQLRSEMATFIAIGKSELSQTLELVDCIIVGPGLEESEETVELTRFLLTTYRHKRIVVDATSFWHIDPTWLHERSIVTPHSREFENVFEIEATPKAVQSMANKYHCTIILTGKDDYISSGQELWVNTTGNVGMTKGGTGDVLVGLLGALYATNDALVSALAAAYLNGFAGDRLHERVGTFYTAEDVIHELGRLWKECITTT